MAEVQDADLGDGSNQDYWATTAQVRDRLQIEIKNQEPDFETAIIEATDAMQSRWEGATGKTSGDYPADVPSLLQYATAYLAASEAHLHFAANVSGENQGDQKHVFLENKAEQKFSDWKQQADLDAGSEPAGSDDGIGSVSGRRGSLTDDII
jgi:hypothetical protein